jgi:hypothetical protein
MRAARSIAVVFALLGVFATRGEAGEVVASPGAFAAAPSEERAVVRVLDAYVRAIEVKDVDLFKTVKPNLSPDEERRARKAFESLHSQAIVMTILSVEVSGASAQVKVSRRDTINKTIVSSFPQTFSLEKAKDGWAIRDIGH